MLLLWGCERPVACQVHPVHPVSQAEEGRRDRRDERARNRVPLFFQPRIARMGRMRKGKAGVAGDSGFVVFVRFVVETRNRPRALIGSLDEIDGMNVPGTVCPILLTTNNTNGTNAEEK